MTRVADGSLTILSTLWGRTYSDALEAMRSFVCAVAKRCVVPYSVLSVPNAIEPPSRYRIL